MPPKTTKTESKKEKKAPAAKAAPKHEGRYFEARGGRKTAVSRVRLFAKSSGVTVNGMDLKQYFPEAELQQTVLRPLVAMSVEGSLGVTAKVNGGGLRGQAEAVSLGIARALTLFDGELRKALRKENLLTRDSRMVERKKYGLRKARRAPQWAKR
ncbi:MAG: 30S ribosomal protein S9 [Patescibacteria group bacterium]|nr:30S ribosomal protein S9 [Patescibacteria group bacterium]